MCFRHVTFSKFIIVAGIGKWCDSGCGVGGTWSVCIAKTFITISVDTGDTAYTQYNMIWTDLC